MCLTQWTVRRGEIGAAGFELSAVHQVGGATARGRAGDGGSVVDIDQGDLWLDDEQRDDVVPEHGHESGS
jgi:hypothetical protein